MSGDASVRENVERLRRVLARPEAVNRPVPGGAEREAAVLVPLVERAGELRIIYIRRSEHVDNHRGQIAFPGGRVDPADASLLATALREAHEEVGIAPSSVDVLGRFPTMSTLSGAIAVAPFVGLLAGAVVLRPDPAEVAEIFEAPLAALADPHLRATYELRPEGRAASNHPAILYGGRAIWGLTLRITESLLQIVDATC